jgi:hypothetical protein
MARGSGTSDSKVKPITVRLNRSDYLVLKDHAAAQGISLNSILSDAVARYRAQVEREKAVGDIRVFQARLRSAHGLGTDSVPLLRDLRAGDGRQSASEDVGPAEPDETTPAGADGDRDRTGRQPR